MKVVRLCNESGGWPSVWRHDMPDVYTVASKIPEALKLRMTGIKRNGKLQDADREYYNGLFIDVMKGYPVRMTILQTNGFRDAVTFVVYTKAQLQDVTKYFNLKCHSTGRSQKLEDGRIWSLAKLTLCKEHQSKSSLEIQKEIMKNFPKLQDDIPAHEIKRDNQDVGCVIMRVSDRVVMYKLTQVEMFGNQVQICFNQ